MFLYSWFPTPSNLFRPPVLVVRDVASIKTGQVLKMECSCGGACPHFTRKHPTWTIVTI